MRKFESMEVKGDKIILKSKAKSGASEEKKDEAKKADEEKKEEPKDAADEKPANPPTPITPPADAPKEQPPAPKEGLPKAA